MGCPPVERDKRRFPVTSDQRNEFARDRDKILYSSAFHRLAGITQIVRAGEEDVFHTRQQHTYKVAQVGRRLAEYCLSQVDAKGADTVHPEVVEAACLAHDLGHPPFGHAAEKELDGLVRGPNAKDGIRGQEDGQDQVQADGKLERLLQSVLPKSKAEDANKDDDDIYDSDGFEGNAQTFRILTKLSVRFDSTFCSGLNLTRATLAATLKYPWYRDFDSAKKRKKWSAYQSEKADFEWVTAFSQEDEKAPEAELMDWADDIAYSVHDIEDFHRVGVIPWGNILPPPEGNGKPSIENTRLVEAAVGDWFDAPSDARERLYYALARLQQNVLLSDAVTRQIYDGSREQRRQLRNLTSLWISRFVRSVSMQRSADRYSIKLDDEATDDVRLLKQFARDYIIGLPALRAQQFGQRRIIRDLFEIFLTAGREGNLKLMPARMHYIWEDHRDDKPARLAADCICCLTETEAYRLHQRYTGIESDSVLDPIVR